MTRGERIARSWKFYPGALRLPVILEELKKSLLNNSFFLEKRVMQSFAFRRYKLPWPSSADQRSGNLERYCAMSFWPRSGITSKDRRRSVGVAGTEAHSERVR